jgi:hypothetical protein
MNWNHLSGVSFLIIILQLSLINCTSVQSNLKANNQLKEFTKKDGFNPETKKVSTLLVYNRNANKLTDSKDLLLTVITNTLESKISEIYGESITGGAAINEIAAKLKIKNFDKSIQNLIESQLDGVPLNSETVKNLSTITEKGKVDSLAFPVVDSGSDLILKGNETTIHLILYDGKSGKIQFIAKSQPVSAKKEDINLFTTKPDQAKANVSVTLIDSINLFMREVQTQVKPQNQSLPDQNKMGIDQPKKETTTSISSENDPKEKEALQPLDEWLIKKVKLGLGPLVTGMTGVLFLIL